MFLGSQVHNLFCQSSTHCGPGFLYLLLILLSCSETQSYPPSNLLNASCGGVFELWNFPAASAHQKPWGFFCCFNFWGHFLAWQCPAPLSSSGCLSAVLHGVTNSSSSLYSINETTFPLATSAVKKQLLFAWKTRNVPSSSQSCSRDLLGDYKILMGKFSKAPPMLSDGTQRCKYINTEWLIICWLSGFVPRNKYHFTSILSAGTAAFLQPHTLWLSRNNSGLCVITVSV